MEKSTPPSEVFPARLREARERRGLNQNALAERAGLQPSAISHFESGTRKPSFANLRRLADALEVTTDYLIGRAQDLEGAGTVDKLHRDLEKLTAQDREFVRDMVETLAQRSQSRKGGAS